ncbi:flavin reductase family protein [Streptomyces sp. NPDC047515]|uniref:flavin reductase family protein n=1 Tax=Streptomyces sp. NPDC047515 TaxID=3155380 RepID=UPI0033DC9A42
MTIAPHHPVQPATARADFAGRERTTARAARADFIAAMGNAATGVTVVTTEGPAGRFAQTVSAMCSVTADPPSLLVCVNERSPLAAAAVRNGHFGVSILSLGQAHVSDVFAGRPAPGTGHAPYDFDCADWQTLDTGSPLLRDAAAVFDCHLTDAVVSGTHRVLFGAVTASTVSTSDRPLVHHARTYGAHRPL